MGSQSLPERLGNFHALLSHSIHAAIVEQRSWSPAFLSTWISGESSRGLMSGDARRLDLALGSGSVRGEDLAAAILQGDHIDGSGVAQIKDWKVSGDVDLSNARIAYPVRFQECQIDGVIMAPHSHLRGLSFHDCQMTEVNLEGCEIVNRLEFDASILRTLFIRGISVGGSLSIQHTDFTVGGVQGEDISIQRDFGIVATSSKGDFNLRDAAVGRNILISDLTLKHGLLTLDNSSVEGSVRVRDCNFDRSELAFGSMTIRLRLEFLNIRKAPIKLYFTGTETNTFKEDASVWPDRGGLHLDRFTYNRLSVEKHTLKRHLAWLNLQPRKHLGSDFRSHPWHQLIALLGRRGSVDLARRLAIKQKDRMLWSGAFRSMSPIYLIFSLTSRYGLQPWLPVFWLLTLFFAGGCLLAEADKYEVIAPSSVEFLVARESGTVSALPDEYPNFNPFLYSIDIALPVVNLSQDQYYLVRPTDTLQADHMPLPVRLVSYYMPVHTLVGWFLVSLTILALSGVFERRLLNE